MALNKQLALVLTCVGFVSACGVGIDDEELSAEVDSGDFGEMEQSLAVPTAATDLYIASFNASRTLNSTRTGTVATIYFRVGNNSNSSAAASSINFYASTDAVFGSDDLARPLGTAKAIPALAPRAITFGTTFTAAWPSSFSGGYIVFSIAKTDAITTNNTGGFLLRPDLIVDGLSVSRSGSTIYVDYAVRNTTYGNAGASTTRVRYVGGATPVLFSCLDSVPALGAAVRYPATGLRRLTCALPAGAAGNAIQVTVDDAAKVVEYSESNNSRSAPLAPDYIVDSLVALRSGSTINVDYAAKNTSTIPGGASVTKFRLVGNPTPVSLTCFDNVPALAGSQRYPATGTRRVTCSVPAGAMGSSIEARVDGNGTVPEYSETNNTKLYSLGSTALGPVFQLGWQSGGTVTIVGRVVTAKLAISNVGSSTAGASHLGVYVSPNLDGYVGSSHSLLCNYPVPAIAAGATVNVNATCTVPTSTPPGLQYVLFWPDNLKVVTEANELGKFGFAGKRILIP